MKKTNTTVASAPFKGVGNLCLLVIHVAVPIATVILHPPFVSRANGALPTALFS
jgi:hypothetical protein